MRGPAAHPLGVTLQKQCDHSAKCPEGYLDHNLLKTFFAVSGGRGDLSYQPGHERIPENWYRCPDNYVLLMIWKDIGDMGVKHPELLSLSGNTGEVNSFAGLNLGDLTGGVYNLANLLQGNNLMCFVMQAAQAGIPGVVGGAPSDDLAAKKLAIFKENIGPLLVGCPAMSQYNVTMFGPYPGASGTI
ncbi:hypothetical protein CTheo_2550 [Ceratobasidium theobromae]|uniref:Uncharacterized protein n=1 Tax=Ceratobasidium theobromae TaxID=1582974 RepID=A0A5N5QQM7_9AGAM|nr:hypothetical protein CTheo_2550 [Ceratobasidium theobromae]